MLAPTLVLGTVAVTGGLWMMLFAQLATAIGAILFAVGFWRCDGRLLDSMGARVGLLLVVVGGTISAASIRNGALPFEQQMSPDLANAIVLVGLVMLAGSNYARIHRGRIQRLSLYVIAPGALLMVLVAVVNARAGTDGWRFAELIYALSGVVLALSLIHI